MESEKDQPQSSSQSPSDVSSVPKQRDRDEKGRLVKGTSIRPFNPGRTKAAENVPILRAITEEFSIDEIQLMLRKTWLTAVQEDDWKGMLEVLRFVAAYAIGKPVQRNLNATIDVEKIRDLFMPQGVEDVYEAEEIEDGTFKQEENS